jgi:hypothetical protein
MVVEGSEILCDIQKICFLLANRSKIWWDGEKKKGQLLQ